MASSWEEAEEESVAGRAKAPKPSNRLIDKSRRARLAQRCGGDLLDAAAHFDQIIREACAGHTLPFRFVIRVREFKRSRRRNPWLCR